MKSNLQPVYMYERFLKVLEGKSKDEQLKIVWGWTIQKHLTMKEFKYILDSIYAKVG